MRAGAKASPRLRTSRRALAGTGGAILLLLGVLWPVPAAPASLWYRASGMGRVVRVSHAIAAPPATAPASPPQLRPRPAVAPPTDDHRLDRPPSVGAAQIDRVLAEYGSPAAGLGAVFYDQGGTAGIDPAYLLAFCALCHV